MKEFIIKNFFKLFCILLIIIVVLQTCKKNDKKGHLPITTIDTQFLPGKPVISRDTQYIPKITNTYLTDTLEIVRVELSENYDEMIEQYWTLYELYEDLTAKHNTQNIYTDKIILKDSSEKEYGVVNLSDTVFQNTIVKRSRNYSLTIPTIAITKIITNPYIPKRQLYVGGGIQGNKIDIFNGAEAGILFKNKKDQLFGAKVQKQFNSTPISYGISSYWKIKL